VVYNASHRAGQRSGETSSSQPSHAPKLSNVITQQINGVAESAVAERSMRRLKDGVGVMFTPK
jgi:hypothetical protein